MVLKSLGIQTHWSRGIQ